MSKESVKKFKKKLPSNWRSILKGKGLIPQDWNLRKLTSGQKSHALKQARKYQSVVFNPKKFESRTYSTAKAKMLKEAGYFGEGNKILIPNFGDTTARTKVNTDSVTITRTDSRGRRVIEKVYLHSGPELLRKLQKEFPKPLGPGEYWSLKVGDYNTFIEAGKKDLSQLMKYGTDLTLTGSDGNIHWAERHVHLVKFKFEDGEDHVDMDKKEKQKPYNPNNPTEPNKDAKKWLNKRGK
jgi:hypothetical protein